jgi:NADH dehydrogenase
VIVGGGFAGLAAVRALARAEAEVLLIDKQNHHLFQPLLYQVATASLSPGDIAIPIREVLRKQDNTTVLMGTVSTVDLERRAVEMEERSYRYDYLVVATGVETNYFGEEGWSEFAPGLKTIEEAVEVRAGFLLALERAEAMRDAEAQRAELTFAIVGAGPTGVELAAAVAEIVESVCRDFRHVDTRSARILLIDAMDRVLTGFAPELSERAARDLEELGVEVVLDTRVTAVDAGGLTAETPDGPLRIDTANVVWAAGVKATAIGNALGPDRDRAGRVVVGDDLTVEGHPEVFVVGDLAHRVDPESGAPVPGVAQAAIQTGRFAGRTLAAEIAARARNETPPRREVFTYRDKGSMAIIGRGRAVAEMGRLRIGGPLAFLAWALIHILSLIGFRRKLIVFTEWVWQYLFRSRGVRLIVGDQSKRHRSPESPHGGRGTEESTRQPRAGSKGTGS